jgi:hypothetical protein
MNKTQITLIIIGFILLALMATNPSIEDHKNAIKKEILTSIEDNNLIENGFQKIGNQIGASIGVGLIDNMIDRDNYVLFSLSTIKIVKQNGGVSKKTIAIGIIGQMFIFKKYNSNSKEFTDVFVPKDKISLADTSPEKSKEIDAKYLHIIGTPVKFKDLEIAEFDFPEELNWEEAKINCTKLGIGWRLPTIDELKEISVSKKEIGGFNNNKNPWGSYGFYWSSTVDGLDPWCWQFDNGLGGATDKSRNCNVRAVRPN